MSNVQSGSSARVDLSQGAVKEYTVDLDILPCDVNDAVAKRTGAAPIVPELVKPNEVLAPAFYKRLTDHVKKEQYRWQMLSELQSKWTELYGSEKAGELLREFQHLTKHLDEYGAMIFAALLPTRNFESLVKRYNALLASYGSKTWIHTYINLANHPDFLADQELNAAFLHPLLIALISYRIGGPMRIVDARGKDAYPMSVLAQDNMLHIDNTPFNDEYKVLLTWEKDKASGPKGQNFVFLPGTHKGCRNCFSTEIGVWSTENASIFTTPERIDKVFTFQQEIRGSSKPMIVEATHAEKPLTIVFPSGSLIHHRYRTPNGLARSCLIIAFHLEEDHPGQLIPPEHLDGLTEQGSLLSFLFGQQSSRGESHFGGLKTKGFLSALSLESANIGIVLDKLHSEMDAAEVIKPEDCQLREEQVEQWKKASTTAPTVEELKTEASLIPLGVKLSSKKLAELVGKMMMFDKHGPLDLILYHDSHEEIRKWARNQIREKKVDDVNERLGVYWMPQVEQPSKDHLLTPEQIKECAEQLAALVEELQALNAPIVLRECEKIMQMNAYQSVRQLLLDLGESITRCENCQAFLSTSLFIFWACDMLMGLHVSCDFRIQVIGNKLLANYLSTSILFEKYTRRD